MEEFIAEFSSFATIGLVNGLIYAVVALGFTLILGVMQVINFSHGVLFAFGAYFAFTLQRYFNLPFWVGLIVAPLLVGIIGLILERVAIRRTYGGNPLFGLLLTFGIATALEAVIRMVPIWGKEISRSSLIATRRLNLLENTMGGGWAAEMKRRLGYVDEPGETPMKQSERLLQAGGGGEGPKNQKEAKKIFEITES